MKNTTSYILLLFIAAFLILGCASDDAKNSNNEYIQGLATPILMSSGITPLYLDDYFDSSITFDSIVGHPNLRISGDLSGNQLTLTQRSKLPAMSVVHFYINGDRIDIPIFSSKKQAFLYTYKAGNKKIKKLNIVGDMNAWNPAEGELQLSNGVWKKLLHLVPGVYGYQLEADGKRILDDNNLEQMDNGNGGTNSKIVVKGIPDSRLPKVELLSYDDKKINIRPRNAKSVYAFWNNQLTEVNYHQDSIEVYIPKAASKVKRSHLRIWTHTDAAASNYTMIPLEKGKVIVDAEELSRDDQQCNIMYFVMVDRFNNGNSNNDHSIDDPEIHPRANFKGGDLDGVIQKINDGYFEKLGVNNIWLSPIVKNPEGAFGYYNKNGITSKFSAYHGYWPISFTQISPHFGDAPTLQALIDDAHKKDFNVLLDFVANHVHELHPVYQANKDKNWATDLYLPDGTLNTEKWDEQRLTTWFDVFLPTLNLEKQEVTEMLSDSALYWLETYDFDGFRHDATKHIPENFWRTLTAKVKKYEKESGKKVIQLGETYGTPELINSYINSGMLDGQFDFNVYDALSASICRDDVGFGKAVERIKQSQDYYGTNHVMGNISGNQDRSRFMALATGDVKFDEDSKYAGWSREINTKTAAAYDKLGMLHVLNMTIPGIPVIYYGDEIGLTGGNDPDNRREMYFKNWTSEEQDLFNTIADAAKLRRSDMSLLFGDLEFLQVNDETLVFSRKYFDQRTFVSINNSPEPKEITIRTPLLNISEFKPLYGHPIQIGDSGFIKIDLPAYGYEIIYN